MRGSDEMTIPSPIHDLLEQYEMSWSKPESSGSREGAATGYMEEQLLCEFLPWGEEGCHVLATTGSVELEYAALRKSVGVFDASCRGTILLQGEDRLAFIDRMTTQGLSNMKDGDSKLAFVLNRKGRIVSDVIVAQLPDRVLIDCDVTLMQPLMEHFDSFVVADNVTITNTTQDEHRLWLLGPDSSKLEIPKDVQFPLPIEFLGLEGVAVSVTPKVAEELWKKFTSQDVRPVGWYALNMVRVEEGAPVFNIDFSSTNLPHETSCCSSRVKFDKGCYLGQEVVARMESLGAPKQLLVGLELQTDALPIAGTQIWDKLSDEGGKPIGVVTSSAMSPMHGGGVAIIAMVKKVCAPAGTTVFPWVGAEQIKASVYHLSSKKEDA